MGRKDRMNRDITRKLLIALAAGDCLGSTSEFQSPMGVAETYARKSPDGWPFVPVAGGSFNWRRGESTDDSDQAFAMVKAVVDNGGTFDPEKVAGELVKWYRGGPRDVGGTTANALSPANVPWDVRGYASYARNPANSANGALMRNGVVAGFSQNPNTALRYTIQHSIITHFDPLSVFCCCFHTWLIQRMLTLPASELLDPSGGIAADFVLDFSAYMEHEKDPSVVAWFGKVGNENFDLAMRVFMDARLDKGQYNPLAGIVGGSGYSVLTLEIAMWALHEALTGAPYTGRLSTSLPRGPFLRTGNDVIGWVAMLGRDSDTYAAVAAPLIAAALDFTLPQTMTEKLEVIPKVDALYDANG